MKSKNIEHIFLELMVYSSLIHLNHKHPLMIQFRKSKTNYLSKHPKSRMSNSNYNEFYCRICKMKTTPHLVVIGKAMVT